MLSALALGATQVWSLTLVQIWVLLLLGAWLYRMLKEGQVYIPRTPFTVPILLLILLFVLQLMPLPSFIAGLAHERYFPLQKFTSQVTPSLNFTASAKDSFPLHRSLSVYPYATREALGLFLTYIGLFYFTLAHYQERRRLQRLFTTLLIFGGALALYGIIEHFSGSHRILGWQNPYNKTRLFGTFVNCDHFATYMGMLLALGIGFLLSRIPAAVEAVQKKRRRRKSRGSYQETEEALPAGPRHQEAWEILYHSSALGDPAERRAQDTLIILSLVVMGIALIFTLSRGGIISFLLAMLLLTLYLIKEKGQERRKYFQLAVVLLIAITVTWIGVEPLLKRFEGEEFEKGLVPRMALWKSSLGIIKDFPVLGSGLGTYQYIFPKYQTEEVTYKILWEHAHNDHLQMVTEGGLAGLLIVLGALFFFFRDACRHLWGKGKCFIPAEGRKPRPAPEPYNLALFLGVTTGILVGFFHAFSEFPLRIPANSLMLSVLFALALLSLHRDYYATAAGYYQINISPARKKMGLGLFMVILLLCGLLLVKPALAAYYGWKAQSLGEAGKKPGAKEADKADEAAAKTELAAKKRLRLEKEETETPPSEEALAENYLKRALFFDRGNAQYWGQLGHLYELEAQKAFEQRITGEGRILSTEQEGALEGYEHLQQAAETYKQAVALNPSNPEYHQRLAWVLGNLGQLSRRYPQLIPVSTQKAKAETAYEQAALTEFDLATGLDRANPQRHLLYALWAYERLITLGETQAEAAGASQAWRRLIEREFKQALLLEPTLMEEILDRYLVLSDDFKAIRQIIPRFPEDYLNLAELLNKRGLWTQSKEAYKEALLLAQDKEKPEIYQKYSLALNQNGDYREAVGQLEIALRFQPEDPGLHLALGEALLSVEDYHRALEEYHRALVLSMRSRREHMAPLNLRNPRKAFSELSFSKKDIKYLGGIAHYYGKTGQQDIAIFIWERALAQDPEDANSHFQLALAYDGIGAWLAAVKEYQQAIKLAPRNAVYRTRLAQRYMDNEMLYQAAEEWRQITFIEPLNVSARLQLAGILVRTKNIKEAQQEYERVLQVQPENEEARRGLRKG